uniref:RISC-loading complex subunit tarbp2-like n=1 Tax=Phallusia mammillata TaxID=59560 RepID=A0A6F9DV13_9ASCI|nr:RISC-loading complex subunit tarbp2-like [Phallusia mammillata]
MDAPLHGPKTTDNPEHREDQVNDKPANADTNPVSFINNLGRFHKLKATYKVERKVGALLEVSLTLGNETWLGKGKDKKSAKTTAAEMAIANTSLEIPKQKIKSQNMKALTPTVKLNGLLMSRGLSSSYTLISKKDVGIQAYIAPMPPRSNPANIYTQPISKYYIHDNDVQSYTQDDFQQIPSFNSYCEQTNAKCPTAPYLYKIRLDVDKNTFTGEGKTPQAAKHAAAEKALTFIENQNLPPIQTFDPVLKSEVSELHEVAASHGIRARFNITNETGPAHLRHYTMHLEVGTFKDELLDTERFHVVVTESGLSKKIAKRRAAISALKEMSALPKLTPHEKYKKQPIPKSNNNSVTMHPVSRLLQIMQAKEQPVPIYRSVDTITSKEKKANFVFECSAQNETVSGEGNSKKEAKRIAAESMLLKLGYLQGPVPNIGLQPTKSSLKTNNFASPTDHTLKKSLPQQRRVSFAKS